MGWENIHLYAFHVGRSLSWSEPAPDWPDATYPRLLDAVGACPPEDCGGPCGYAHFLDAIADPSHEDHQEMIAWHGPGSDPGTVDATKIHKALAKFANRRRGELKPNP